MTATGYSSISLPNELMERVDLLIEEFPALGVRSRASFAATAIQELLGRMEQNAFNMMVLRGDADAASKLATLQSLRQPMVAVAPAATRRKGRGPRKGHSEEE